KQWEEIRRSIIATAGGILVGSGWASKAVAEHIPDEWKDWVGKKLGAGFEFIGKKTGLIPESGAETGGMGEPPMSADKKIAEAVGKIKDIQETRLEFENKFGIKVEDLKDVTEDGKLDLGDIAKIQSDRLGIPTISEPLSAEEFGNIQELQEKAPTLIGKIFTDGKINDLGENILKSDWPENVKLAILEDPSDLANIQKMAELNPKIFEKLAELTESQKVLSVDQIPEGGNISKILGVGMAENATVHVINPDGNIIVGDANLVHPDDTLIRTADGQIYVLKTSGISMDEKDTLKNIYDKIEAGLTDRGVPQEVQNYFNTNRAEGSWWARMDKLEAKKASQFWEKWGGKISQLPPEQSDKFYEHTDLNNPEQVGNNLNLFKQEAEFRLKGMEEEARKIWEEGKTPEEELIGKQTPITPEEHGAEPKPIGKEPEEIITQSEKPEVARPQEAPVKTETPPEPVKPVEEIGGEKKVIPEMKIFDGQENLDQQSYGKIINDVAKKGLSVEHNKQIILGWSREISVLRNELEKFNLTPDQAQERLDRIKEIVETSKNTYHEDAFNQNIKNFVNDYKIKETPLVPKPEEVITQSERPEVAPPPEEAPERPGIESQEEKITRLKEQMESWKKDTAEKYGLEVEDLKEATMDGSLTNNELAQIQAEKLGIDSLDKPLLAEEFRERLLAKGIIVSSTSETVVNQKPGIDSKTVIDEKITAKDGIIEKGTTKFTEADISTGEIKENSFNKITGLMPEESQLQGQEADEVTKFFDDKKPLGNTLYEQTKIDYDKSRVFTSYDGDTENLSQGLKETIEQYNEGVATYEETAKNLSKSFDDLTDLKNGPPATEESFDSWKYYKGIGKKIDELNLSDEDNEIFEKIKKAGLEIGPDQSNTASVAYMALEAHQDSLAEQMKILNGGKDVLKNGKFTGKFLKLIEKNEEARALFDKYNIKAGAAAEYRKLAELYDQKENLRNGLLEKAKQVYETAGQQDTKSLTQKLIEDNFIGKQEIRDNLAKIMSEEFKIKNPKMKKWMFNYLIRENNPVAEYYLSESSKGNGETALKNIYDYFRSGVKDLSSTEKLDAGIRLQRIQDWPILNSFNRDKF
ncbi:MAG: hypothetical protein PHZ04_03845, partial [Patescibacteria group bacterium]|nr:hypothetical protein [Patescibacteria group bacterium]